MRPFLLRSGRTRASLALAAIAIPLFATLTQHAGADVGDVLGCGETSTRTDPLDPYCVHVPGSACVAPSATHEVPYGATPCGMKMIWWIPVPCGLPAQVGGACP